MLFTIQDYKDTLLFEDSFKTLPLVPCRDENDEFIFSSGRTAVVFKMQHKERGTLHALKCFTQLHPETFQRSRAISRYLQNNPASYLVNYLALDEELWVQDRFLPVICMDWIEGETLAQYLRRLIEAKDTYHIFHLALSFDRLALWLLEQPFAHGDLKTDNILITPQGNLILVDYEGSFVPELKGKKAIELGTLDYQHPQRNENFFNSHLDDISILVISTALHALVAKPELWQTYHKGENLLFSHQDLLAPTQSSLWKELLELDNSFLKNRLNLLLFGLFQLQPILGLKEVLWETYNTCKHFIAHLPQEEPYSINRAITDAPKDSQKFHTKTIVEKVLSDFQARGFFEEAKRLKEALKKAGVFQAVIIPRVEEGCEYKNPIVQYGLIVKDAGFLAPAHLIEGLEELVPFKVVSIQRNDKGVITSIICRPIRR